MTHYTEEQIRKGMARIETIAAQKKEDARLGGCWSDNGATEMLARMEIWWAGYQQRFPDFMKEAIEEAIKSDDPEYHEYIRLKEKFGDK